MTPEKTEQLGRDIQETVRDLGLDAVQEDVESVVRRYRDTAPTEVLAAIAFEAFSDGCGAYEIDYAHTWFAERFPVLAEYVL